MKTITIKTDSIGWARIEDALLQKIWEIKKNKQLADEYRGLLADLRECVTSE